MKKQLILLIIMSFFGFGKSIAQSKKQFKDAPNTAVFTTKFVLKEKKIITYVTHNEDGSWQFFSNDRFENFEEVAAVVSLSQIIKIDETLVEVADLPLGYLATRKKLNDKWRIERQE